MSNYFRTLRRLEEKHSAGSPAPGAEETDRSSDSERALPSSIPISAPVLEMPAANGERLSEQQIALTGLLDSLRAQASDSRLPLVVLAGISEDESLAAVVAGLAEQTAERGLDLFLAELSLSGNLRILRQNGGPPATELSPAGASPFELPRVSSQHLKEWLTEAAVSHDLLVVKAPPLLRSVDAALLAKRGAGLILVVQPGVTTRQALKTAAGRARSAGCPILGLVMNGTTEWLPGWLRVLFKSPLDP